MPQISIIYDLGPLISRAVLFRSLMSHLSDKLEIEYIIVAVGERESVLAREICRYLSKRGNHARVVGSGGETDRGLLFNKAIKSAETEILFFGACNLVLGPDCLLEHHSLHARPDSSPCILGIHDLDLDQKRVLFPALVWFSKLFPFDSGNSEYCLNTSIKKSFLKKFDRMYLEDTGTSSYLTLELGELFSSKFCNKLSKCPSRVYMPRNSKELREMLARLAAGLMSIRAERPKIFSDLLTPATGDSLDIPAIFSEVDSFWSYVTKIARELDGHGNFELSLQESGDWKEDSRQILLASLETLKLLSSIYLKSSILDSSKSLGDRLEVENIAITTNSQRPLSVLMQIREDAFSQPGGDTFVMKSLSRELAALGVHVDIDVEGNADPRKYDLVHLHNMVVPTGIQKQAQKCVEFKVPYVVTALQEDWYAFFNKMIAHGESLIAYFNKVNEVTIDSVMEYLSGKHFDKLPDAHFVARYAEAVFASGIQEKLNINEFYPFCKRVEICHFGSSVGAIADSGELFYKEYGIKDFIFCVGRLECKKNQLSLLKAFEDSSIPIVFAGGGKMVQEHYENAARKVQRKGKTLFLERISAEMLASAYAASRVHAMPSWWELPGLVSLEAALYGTQVVGVEGGTLSDYLGNSAFYCKPDSPEDIRKVVTEAYHAEVSPLLKTRASMFTWKRSAEEHLNIYETVLGRVHRQAEKPISKNVRTIESRSQLSS